MASLVTRVAPASAPTGLSFIARSILNSPTDNNNVTAESNSPIAKPEHTCVREALVALANWRQHCDGPGIPPTKCWTRAPNIERCCGKWVDTNDEKYKDYPPVRTSKEVQIGKTAWEWRWNPKTAKKGHRREIVLQSVDEYNTGKTECKRWRPESEGVFFAYMQHLREYGIFDADNTGKVIDSKSARYNPEGGGYYDDGQQKYPSLGDGPPIGW
ncbi:hypothetical protein AYL99_10845 [Fonsecaea erecta]|uniref:Uncharacterized protein n=1 Tax=Fonsecaea erecta TaxID=1367422 RepID=A0A178Z7Y1_9EURO|nr:hypothetical protein AYL99_10845 [Fonsecaea erecta]OAP55145.1 hypothetical protein AYL99_10845 [Fonsecaea erecta]